MTAASVTTTQEYEHAKQTTMKLFADEPAYRIPLRKLLVYCQNPRTMTDIEQAVAAYPEMRHALHNARSLVNWLEKAGAIVKLVPEKGEPTWQTTDAGRDVADQLSPDKKLRELLAREPTYADIYQHVLQFCTTPRSLADIEKLLKDDPRVGAFTVLPTYFVQNLEAAGGLEWVGKWQTTEAGKGGGE